MLDDVEDYVNNPLVVEDGDTTITYRLRNVSDYVENLAEIDEDKDLEEVYTHIDNLNKDAGDVSEFYLFETVKQKEGEDADISNGVDEDLVFLVNTSGRVVDDKGRSKDGSDYYYVTGNNGELLAVYLEN